MEPVVGHLDLAPGHDALAEDPVFVADAVAIGGDLERRHRVQVTCGKSTEPPVPQARIRFHLLQLFQPVPEWVQSLGGRLRQLEIDQRIAQRSAHEKLEREVVDPLGVALTIAPLRRGPTLGEPVADAPRRAHVEITVARHPPIEGERIRDVVRYVVLE